MIVVLMIGDEVDSVWHASHPDAARNQLRIFDSEWELAREAAIAAKKERYAEGTADEEGHCTEDIIHRMLFLGWKMERTEDDDFIVVED